MNRLKIIKLNLPPRLLQSNTNTNFKVVVALLISNNNDYKLLVLLNNTPLRVLPQEWEDKLDLPENDGEQKLRTNKYSIEQCATLMKSLSPSTQKKASSHPFLMKNLTHIDKLNHHQTGLIGKSQ